MTEEEKVLLEDYQQEVLDHLRAIRRFIESMNELRSRENTIQPVSSEAGFDFEAIYKLYPRKLGKANGIRKLKVQIKTQEQYDQLRRAVKNFINHHVDYGTDPSFIPYFSSFVSVWTDWTLPETGSTRLGSYPSESTADYVERTRKKAQEEEEEWADTDPAKVREIINQALGRNK